MLLLVIDANNRCWKPCHLCVTLAVVTIPEIVIWLMVAVMVMVAMDDVVWMMVMVELVSSCLVDACGWSPLPG